MRPFAVVILAICCCCAAVPSAHAVDATGRHVMAIGRSVNGRLITAVETGDFDSPAKMLVIGCIHGNEPAGIAVTARLVEGAPPSETDLWVIRNLNPDGTAASTRGNAHGVDLNRNFTWRWRPLSGVFYSGPRALSEPESRAAYAVIRRVDPSVSIWFHQHLDVVDESGGDVGIERRFARLTGMRLARLAREPGSAVGWQNHYDRDGAAFVVELPPGRLSAGSSLRFAHAVYDLMR